MALAGLEHNIQAMKETKASPSFVQTLVTFELAATEIGRLRAALSVTRDYLNDIGDHPEPGDMIKMIDDTLNK